MQFLDGSAAIPLELGMLCLVQNYQIWKHDAIHNLVPLASRTRRQLLFGRTFCEQTELQ
jgi:hypothetical protein